MDPQFRKVVEDFTCGHCGMHVIGNGYTNHCPQCLWSQHVDVNPGDRAAGCGALMEPVSVEGSTGKGYRIRHRCQKCSHEKVNDASQLDSRDALIALANARGSV